MQVYRFRERGMTDIELFRHTLATLAYRGGKVMREAPAEFAAFRVGTDGRTAGDILAHMSDLLDWALALCDGRHEWHDSPAIPWDLATTRFFAALEKLDRRARAPISAPVERLFQGLIADALTHTGQLAMMRRLAGAPVLGENYYVAEITAGRVGAQQARAVREFA
jgi:hypothetical protein